jgi:hypothetical protein
VQHQLFSGTSVTAGYYGNRYYNFHATRNAAAPPSDYSPFCVTAPVNPNLPDGGGCPICCSYNVNPAHYGKITNLVSQAATYGNETLASIFFAVSVDRRFGSGGRVGGGTLSNDRMLWRLLTLA